MIRITVESDVFSDDVVVIAESKMGLTNWNVRGYRGGELVEECDVLESMIGAAEIVIQMHTRVSGW